MSPLVTNTINPRGMPVNVLAELEIQSFSAEMQASDKGYLVLQDILILMFVTLTTPVTLMLLHAPQFIATGPKAGKTLHRMIVSFDEGRAEALDVTRFIRRKSV